MLCWFLYNLHIINFYIIYNVNISNILAWRIPWTDEPGGLLSMGSHRVRHDWSDFACMHACIVEGNGSPLKCSCLENPRDRGAWWAAIYGVAQSRTRLKQLCMHACIGEGNGNPLQYACLENPMDRGAWWAAICGVAQSRTWLKRLSSGSRAA